MGKGNGGEEKSREGKMATSIVQFKKIIWPGP